MVAGSALVLASGCSTTGVGGATVGGIIGHQDGKALEGAAIGGILGELLDRNRKYDDRPIERDRGYQEPARKEYKP